MVPLARPKWLRAQLPRSRLASVRGGGRIGLAASGESSLSVRRAGYWRPFCHLEYGICSSVLPDDDLIVTDASGALDS